MKTTNNKRPVNVDKLTDELAQKIRHEKQLAENIRLKTEQRKAEAKAKKERDLLVLKIVEEVNELVKENFDRITETEMREFGVKLWANQNNRPAVSISRDMFLRSGIEMTFDFNRHVILLRKIRK